MITPSWINLILKILDRRKQKKLIPELELKIVTREWECPLKLEIDSNNLYKVIVLVGIVHNKGKTKSIGVEPMIKITPKPDSICKNKIPVPEIVNLERPTDIKFGEIDINPKDEKYFHLCHSAPDYVSNEIHIYENKDKDIHLRVDDMERIDIYLHSQDPLGEKDSIPIITVSARELFNYLQIVIKKTTK